MALPEPTSTESHTPTEVAPSTLGGEPSEVHSSSDEAYVEPPTVFRRDPEDPDVVIVYQGNRTGRYRRTDDGQTWNFDWSETYADAPSTSPYNPDEYSPFERREAIARFERQEALAQQQLSQLSIPSFGDDDLYPAEGDMTQSNPMTPTDGPSMQSFEDVARTRDWTIAVCDYAPMFDDFNSSDDEPSWDRLSNPSVDSASSAVQRVLSRLEHQRQQAASSSNPTASSSHSALLHAPQQTTMDPTYPAADPEYDPTSPAVEPEYDPTSPADANEAQAPANDAPFESQIPHLGDPGGPWFMIAGHPVARSQLTPDQRQEIRDREKQRRWERQIDFMSWDRIQRMQRADARLHRTGSLYWHYLSRRILRLPITGAAADLFESRNCCLRRQHFSQWVTHPVTVPDPPSRQEEEHLFNRVMAREMSPPRHRPTSPTPEYCNALSEGSSTEPHGLPRPSQGPLIGSTDEEAEQPPRRSFTPDSSH